MTVKLYPHQFDYVQEIREALRKNNSVLAQAATGFGKTQVAAHMIKNAHDKNYDCMMMMHRKELVFQTSETFRKNDIPHSFVSSEYHHNPRMRVNIASVGSLVNRLEKIRPPKLLIVDECHHSTSVTWFKCINWAKSCGAKIVGLSATPWRLSGEGLHRHFDHMVLGPEISWLMNNINPHTGMTYLSKYRAFSPYIPDLSKVHFQGGDFVNSEIEEIMSGKVVVNDCVGQWKSKAFAKRTVGFAASVKHSMLLVKEFNAAGIPAVHIDADTPKEERKLHIMNFAAGYIPILFNCDLLSEGFDLSAIAGRDVPIEAVIQMRPTQSLSLHLQQLGRGLRPKMEPALLLDMCGNIKRHGLPDDKFEWTLADREKRKKGEAQEDVEPIKQCPSCYFCHSPNLQKCPNCGHVYEVSGRTLEEIEGDLEEITKEKLDFERASSPKISNARVDKLNLPFEELMKAARNRGLPPGKAEKWAAARFTSNLAKKRAYGVQD